MGSHPDGVARFDTTITGSICNTGADTLRGKAELIPSVAKPLSCNKLSSHGCGGGERGVEHKGGPVIAFGADGYNCLKTWVQGITDPGACQRAANAY